MSEIIKINGQICKIGSCESLYYTTYQQYKKALDNGQLKGTPGNDTPDNYINGLYRFRFPFPDENFEIGMYEDFDRGVYFEIPSFIGIKICHGEQFHRTDKVNSKLPAVGFNLPCIQSDEFPVKIFDWSHTKSKTIFEVIQQKPVNGNLELVVRCPYCGAACRFDKREINNFVSFVWANRNNYSELQIITAIRAAKGYKMSSKLVEA